MRIQYMSDLHMELWDNSRYIRANEFEVAGDVLVLAGDTFYLRDTVAPQQKCFKRITTYHLHSFRIFRLFRCYYIFVRFDQFVVNSIIR